jgi:hypothetical protein
VNRLLAKKTSLAGSMNKMRLELPPPSQNKAPAQPLYSTAVLKNDKTTGHNSERTGDHYGRQPNKGMSKCVKPVNVTKMVATVATRDNSYMKSN